MTLPGAARGDRSLSGGPPADPAGIDAHIGAGIQAHIQAQIAEEFADHIQRLERDLIQSGTPAPTAAALARRRFGDADRLARECRTIALKEHLMLKRIHLAVTILLALLLTVSILLGVSAARRAQRAAHMARAMAEQARATAELARMNELEARQRAQAAEEAVQAAPPPQK